MRSNSVLPFALDNQKLSDLQLAAYRILLKRKGKSLKKRGAFVQFLVFFLKLVFGFHVVYFGCVLLLSVLFTFFTPATSAFMAYRAFVDGTEVKPTIFVPIKNIPQSMQRAFIRLEDHGFYQHKGISLGAIREAMQRNEKLGRTVFGGSTITQQLARNLFLNPERTYLRKYLEAGTALIIDAVLGKKRVLELYMNFIEFGPGVFGLGQASRYHYKTDFKNLGYEQRVRMAVIITSPLLYNVKNYTKNPGMVARYRALLQ